MQIGNITLTRVHPDWVRIWREDESGVVAVTIREADLAKMLYKLAMDGHAD